MSDILLEKQSAPTTPSADQGILFLDNTTEKFTHRDDAGNYLGSPLSRNFSTASQGAGFATDTYIANSGILIPSYGMQAGHLYQWAITWSKTAAGIATPIVIVRIGAAQTVADTARSTMTGQAATAAVSGGIMLVNCFVRSVSASGVIVCGFGFVSGVLGPGGGIDNVGAAFDNSALGGQFVGLSFNAGASAAVTVTSVRSWLEG